MGSKKNDLPRESFAQSTAPDTTADDRPVVVAGIYARFSSANQSPESCQTQTNDILRQVQSGKVLWHTDPDARVVVPPECIFHDDGETGRNANRLGFEQAKAAIRDGTIKKLLVADTSRAARKVKDLMTLVELCVYYDCELVFAWDRLSTANPDHRQVLLLKGVIDESSNTQHALRTVVHMRSRAEQGNSLGSLPHGYSSRPTHEVYRKGRPVPSHFEIFVIPERAEVVHRIYTEFADGLGLRRIARHLNDARIPAPGNSHLREGKIGGWSVSTLRNIIRNPRYVGVWRWRTSKRLVDPETGKVTRRDRPESEHVAMTTDDSGLRYDLRIIEPELWERAQTRLREITRNRAEAKTEAQRLFGTEKPKTSEAYHLFTTNLRCGACGARAMLASGRQGGRYGCHNAHRVVGACSVTQTVLRTKLEDCLLRELRDAIDTHDCAERCAELYNITLRKRLGQDPEELARLRRERASAEAEGLRLVDFVAKGDTSEMVRQRLQRTEERIAQLSGKILAIETAQRDPILMTAHAMRQRLRDMVELLQGEPVRARPIIAKLFPEPIRLVLVRSKPRPLFEAQGRIVLTLDETDSATPAMTHVFGVRIV